MNLQLVKFFNRSRAQRVLTRLGFAKRICSIYDSFRWGHSALDSGLDQNEMRRRGCPESPDQGITLAYYLAFTVPKKRSMIDYKDFVFATTGSASAALAPPPVLLHWQQRLAPSLPHPLGVRGVLRHRRRPRPLHHGELH